MDVMAKKRELCLEKRDQKCGISWDGAFGWSRGEGESPKPKAKEWELCPEKKGIRKVGSSWDSHGSEILGKNSRFLLTRCIFLEHGERTKGKDPYGFEEEKGLSWKQSQTSKETSPWSCQEFQKPGAEQSKRRPHPGGDEGEIPDLRCSHFIPKE